jgi:hypothetical protein
MVRKAQSTPLQVKMVTPPSKRKSPTRGGKEETCMISILTILCCLSITITCQILPLTLPYSLAKLPVLIGQTIAYESIA